jgi:hypothetical protein
MKCAAFFAGGGSYFSPSIVHAEKPSKKAQELFYVTVFLCESVIWGRLRDDRIASLLERTD